MKKLFKLIFYGLLALTECMMASCKKNETMPMPPLIYLTRTVNGTIEVGSEDVTINKSRKTATLTLGISRSGLQDAEPFSVEIHADTASIPDGTIALKPNQYTVWVSDSGKNITKVDVPAGQTATAFYLTLPESVFSANSGKKLALDIRLSDASKYALNEQLATTTIIINVDDFIGAYTDVTSTYIKNPGGTPAFQHGDWGGRYGILNNWIVNDAVKNQNGFGGYDADPVDGGPFLSMETWGGPLIPNGKIYQTVKLPKGKYIFNADMHSGQIYPQTKAYIAVIDGDAFPDVDNISTAMNYINIDVSDLENNKLVFELTEETEVSLGFVADLTQSFQYFRVRGVTLSKQVNVFE